MDTTRKVTYTCPACGQAATTTLAELRKEAVACSICTARHSAATIREKVRHELSEMEKAYVEYAENVEL
jgi:hypothetical protein